MFEIINKHSCFFYNLSHVVFMKKETKSAKGGNTYAIVIYVSDPVSLVVTPYSLSGVRNYLKEALVNIITVHAEVKSYSHEDKFPSLFLFDPCFI